MTEEKTKRLNTVRNNEKDGRTKDFEEKLLDVEEKKLQLARNQFEKSEKMRDDDCKEKPLRTCKKFSDDGFPDHSVFKYCPDFKAEMSECEEDSEGREDECAGAKGKDEEESIEVEEA